MKHKPVQQALQPHFKLDPRRLDFIARYITALLQVCTVNLNILGTALSSNRIESNARRIKRFLNFDLPQTLIAQFVLSFMTDTKLVLTSDPARRCAYGVKNGLYQLEIRTGKY